MKLTSADSDSLSNNVKFLNSSTISNKAIPSCYVRLTSDSERNYIVFAPLLQFTNSSGGCFGRYCPTIFWRRFNRKQELLHHPISYSCCSREIPAPKINISTCLVPRKQKWIVPIVQKIAIIISSLIAATMLDKLISNFLKELDNYRSTPTNYINVQYPAQTKLVFSRYCEQKSHLTSDEGQDQDHWII
ncbi:hypothetical protein TrispH2_008791, partial [Trichoplax sp. H2]